MDFGEGTEHAWDGLCAWLDATLFSGTGPADMDVEQDCDALVAQLAQDQDACATFYSYFLQRVQDVGAATAAGSIQTFLKFSKNVREFCSMIQPGYDEIEVNSILVAIVCRTESLCSDMKQQVESHFRASITEFTTAAAASDSLSTPPPHNNNSNNSSSTLSDFISEFQDPLGLITLCEPILKGLVTEATDAHIHTELRSAPSLAEHHDAFTRSQAWLEGRMHRWVDSALPPASSVPGIPDLNGRLRRHAGAHLYETFAGVWVPVAYSLAVAYPATEGVLRGLRACLERLPHLYSALRASLLASVGSRLLTVGAATSTIILAFIKLVKAVKVVDPTGIVLAAVSAPIRDYLRGRKDAVQCVVDAFVHKTSSEIEDAFRQKPTAAGAGAGLATEPSLEWTPDPVSPDPTFSLARMAAQATGSSEGSAPEAARSISDTHTSDIIELLEEIWGGPEAFTERYVVALAESLLSKADHATEAAQVELLKQRFGDYLMQGCEVMLGDVEAHDPQPSTPVPRAGRGGGGGGGREYLPVLRQRGRKGARARGFSADVLSHFYWPEGMLDRDARVVRHFPDHVQREMARYAETDPKRFLCKKIEWTGDLGYVDLDIRVPSTRALRTFSVPPIYATVVLEFSKRPACTVAEIAEALEISPETARKSLAFWAKSNVLYPCGGDTYKILCDTGAAQTSASMSTEESSSMSSMSVSFLTRRGHNGSSNMSRSGNDDDDDDNETEVSLLIQSLVMSSPEGMTLEEVCGRVKEELGESNITNAIVSANLEFLIISGVIEKDGDKYKIAAN